MKIFSNFDTRFREKVLARQLERFKSEDMFILRRSRYHLYFRVILHLVGYLLFYTIFLIILLYYLESYQYIIVFVTSFIFLFMLWFRVGHKLLKYLYDFTIVTPNSIFTYKQKGILYSVMKEIPTNRIRSIQVSRNTFLENVFSYGTINIHADYTEDPHLEEDNESAFVIGLTYVDDPLHAKNIISDICFHDNIKINDL